MFCCLQKLGVAVLGHCLATVLLIICFNRSPLLLQLLLLLKTVEFLPPAIDGLDGDQEDEDVSETLPGMRLIYLRTYARLLSLSVHENV